MGAKKSNYVKQEAYGDPITGVRLPKELTAALDRWAESKGLTRSEAIRRLIERGIGLSDDRVTKLEAELRAARQQLAAVHRAAMEIVTVTKSR